MPPEEVTNGTSRSSTPKRTHAEAFSADQAAYLHPASPTQHRASIASIGEVHPGNRAPDDGGIGGMRGEQEEKKPAKMVRSSIACARCRRSKVKCEFWSLLRNKAAYVHVGSPTEPREIGCATIFEAASCV